MTALPEIQFLLAHGDRMSRKEFLDRWYRLPGLKRAELIEGVVHLPSPLSQPHARFTNLMNLWLGYYTARTPGTEALAEATWLMTRTSAPQPDVCLRRVGAQARSKIGEKNLLSGIPDLVVEVCGSSRAYDLGPKLALYQSAGVPEYLALLLEEQRVEWRVLRDRKYHLLRTHKDGTLRSQEFPGLWLDTKALWSGDAAGLVAALDRGLA